MGNAQTTNPSSKISEFDRILTKLNEVHSI